MSAAQNDRLISSHKRSHSWTSKSANQALLPPKHFFLPNTSSNQKLLLTRHFQTKHFFNTDIYQILSTTIDIMLLNKVLPAILSVLLFLGASLVSLRDCSHSSLTISETKGASNLLYLHRPPLQSKVISSLSSLLQSKAKHTMPTSQVALFPKVRSLDYSTSMRALATWTELICLVMTHR